MKKDKDLDTYQNLTAIAGAIYLLWWFAVDIVLPTAFNPIGSRIAVVGTILAICGFSYVSPWIYRNIKLLFMGCTWLITIHYYYLFYFNVEDINWVIGCYITVIAISLGLHSNTSLLSYSIFVTLLSAGLVFSFPELNASVFLPGLVTILIQANVGLRSRLAVLKKVEKEKLLALALKENIRIRDEFISIASHELRTPISSLRIQAQLIERAMKRDDQRVISKEGIAEFVALFHRQINRLIELVDVMLDASRISAGRLMIERSEVDLVQVIQDVISNLKVQNSCSDIYLKTPESLKVWVDRSRMQQVFENLVANAIKYGRGNSIDIKLEGDDKRAVFCIRDHGQGIPEEHLERIFERFERAMSPRNITGLGLGLYIAKQIVDLHGGTIEVKSEVDVGSTFTVILPLALRDSLSTTQTSAQEKL